MSPKNRIRSSFVHFILEINHAKMKWLAALYKFLTKIKNAKTFNRKGFGAIIKRCLSYRHGIWHYVTKVSKMKKANKTVIRKIKPFHLLIALYSLLALSGIIYRTINF